MATTFITSQSSGVSVTMDTTGIQNLAGSSTITAWQSQLVTSGNVATAFQDYQVSVKLAMSTSAPAGDKAVYCYVAPWYNNAGTWLAPSTGNSALSNSTTGGATTLSPVGNCLGNPVVFGHYSTSEVIGSEIFLSSIFPGSMPDGWQLILIANSTAQVLTSTSTSLSYKGIKYESTG